MWDITWAVADVIAVAALGFVSVPAGLVAGVGARMAEEATSTGLTGMKGLAERNGWLSAPPDETTFRRDLQRDRDDLAALQAATVVTATFEVLVASGRMPLGTASPPAPTAVDDRSDGGTAERYLDAYNAWQDDLLRQATSTRSSPTISPACSTRCSTRVRRRSSVSPCGRAVRSAPRRSAAIRAIGDGQRHRPGSGNPSTG